MARSSYRTKPYRLVYDFLQGNEGTATVEEIHRSLPQIDVSTIYRNLEKMVDEGIVLKFPDELGKKACYEASHEDCGHHLHLKCTECGKVIHLDCEGMQEFVQHLKADHGFDLSYGNTVLYGLCDECGKKKRNH